jgi:hypothetical protein
MLEKCKIKKNYTLCVWGSGWDHKKRTKNAGRSYIKKQIRFPQYVAVVVIRMVW